MTHKLLSRYFSQRRKNLYSHKNLYKSLYINFVIGKAGSNLDAYFFFSVEDWLNKYDRTNSWDNTQQIKETNYWYRQ